MVNQISFSFSFKFSFIPGWDDNKAFDSPYNSSAMTPYHAALFAPFRCTSPKQNSTPRGELNSCQNWCTSEFRDQFDQENQDMQT